MRSAQRVGLSKVEGNAEYSQRVVNEARNAEDTLEELRRKANLVASRCKGQLEVVDREVRIEMEQRQVAENITKELEALRAEMRRKEAAQEEHLGNLYRAFAGPAPQPPSWGSAYADHMAYRSDGAYVFPTVISSAVPLSEGPLSARPNWSASAQPLQGEHLGHWSASSQQRAVAAPTTEFPPSRWHGEAATESIYHRQQPQQLVARRDSLVAPPRGPDASEALDLLRRNQEKLKSLERYGV
jgi:hypothetical protein